MKTFILIAHFFSLSLYAQTGHELIEKQYSNGFESISYKIYSPENIKDKAPLLLYLHGCTQDADIFFHSTRIKQYADKYQFKVLLPIQSANKNPKKCWNWFTPISTSKLGETLLLANLLDRVIQDENIDHNKVFIAGFSAGAAMSNVLVNCYPEKFSAMGAHDGAAYKALNSIPMFQPLVSAFEGFACSNWGYGYNKAPYNKKLKQVPAILFHSDASKPMPSQYSINSLQQLMYFNDFLDNALIDNSVILTKTEIKIPKSEIHAQTKTEYKDLQNRLFYSLTLVHEQDHNWSGGDEKYPHNDAQGPNATAEIIEFFRVWGL